MERRKRPPNRAKKSPPAASSEAGGSAPESAEKSSAKRLPAKERPEGRETAAEHAYRPSSRVRTLLSVFLVFHLAAVGLSLFAVVETSRVHASLLQFVEPYLQITHFGVDSRPIYLAHAGASEQPFRLQVTGDETLDQADWTTIHPAAVPGLASNDRYRRWLATAVMLSESVRASLVAELLLPVAAADDSIAAIRILRLPTNLTTVLEDAEPPPYTARVVRDGDRVSLVHLPEQRLTATALPAETDDSSNAQEESSDEQNAAAGDEDG